MTVKVVCTTRRGHGGEGRCSGASEGPGKTKGRDKAFGKGFCVGKGLERE